MTDNMGLAAYLFFCRDNRDKVRAEFPEMTVSQVTAEVGKRWNELPDEERARYVTKAHEDRERYYRTG